MNEPAVFALLLVLALFLLSDMASADDKLHDQPPPEPPRERS